MATKQAGSYIDALTAEVVLATLIVSPLSVENRERVLRQMDAARETTGAAYEELRAAIKIEKEN